MDSGHGTHTVEQAPFHMRSLRVYATDDRASTGLCVLTYTFVRAHFKLDVLPYISEFL